MNLFFGGPPEESLKRQVGEKASGPDVSEKTGSRHNEKYEQDITALREKFENSFITGLCVRITLRSILPNALGQVVSMMRHVETGFIL